MNRRSLLMLFAEGAPPLPADCEIVTDAVRGGDTLFVSTRFSDSSGEGFGLHSKISRYVVDGPELRQEIAGHWTAVEAAAADA